MATILVVEDREESRRTLTRLLRQEGYQVLTASDAFSATAMVHNNHPDLMLLDVGIPPVDGLTMLMLLRQESPRQDVPVILVTAAKDPNTVARGQQMGVKAHLVKSEYNPAELLALVRTYLPQAAADAAADPKAP